ncbi:hypothetical protein C790_03275 [Morganella morganii SC01]|nr:hypothetical protein C790_03275 [Morganella morganii SC01]
MVIIIFILRNTSFNQHTKNFPLDGIKPARLQNGRRDTGGHVAVCPLAVFIGGTGDITNFFHNKASLSEGDN